MTRDEIARQIVNATFTQRTLATGYDQRGVDDFLDRLRDVVVAGDPVDGLRSLVDGARFTTRRGGYDQAEVDSFIDRIVLRCAEAVPEPAPGEGIANGRPIETGRRPDTSSGPSALPSLSSGPSAPPSRTDGPNAPVSGSGGSALIEPRPGLLTRLGRRLRKG
ncbi:MAG: DivIVA domain-containing protein [Humibacillus sp.]|nr:DivIVA domain-containing protein [Humibacillus sp.]MDN5779867.1 DivIVA domain-containing protein [Humibacillus sp.]